MIKVFYDHQKFSTQKYGGISKYFANIIQSIKTSPEFDYQLGILLSDNHYLKEQDKIFSYLSKKILDPKYVYKLNQAYNKYILSKNNFDVFHPTYYDTYFLDKLKKPLVITIHDMTYERHPEYFWAKDPLTSIKRLNIERADQIIAISETTKNDLIKYLSTNPDKIKVIHHGIDLNTPFETQEVNNIPENYVLFVGDRSGYKNFYLFINAFREISLRNPKLKVVVTGGGNLEIAELEHIRRLNLSDKVFHFNVSDQELNYLYQNAEVFVYPSLHEGFGLPILEAFIAQCPIILSDIECFREIAQDGAVYFDPKSQTELVNNLEKLIYNIDLKNNLIKAGNKRVKDFPLDKSIDETFKIYKKIV